MNKGANTVIWLVWAVFNWEEWKASLHHSFCTVTRGENAQGNAIFIGCYNMIVNVPMTLHVLKKSSNRVFCPSYTLLSGLWLTYNTNLMQYGALLSRRTSALVRFNFECRLIYCQQIEPLHYMMFPYLHERDQEYCDGGGDRREWL